MLAALHNFVRWRIFPRPLFLTLVALAIALLQVTAAGADPLAQWQWRNPLPQGNTLRSVAAGASGFVAVGDAGTIVTSADGTQWSSHAPVGNTNDLKAICYGKKKFIAVGAAGTILSSPDGGIWSDLTANFRLPSGQTVRPSLNAISFGNDRFYAVGDGGTLLTSTDGITWTNNTNTTSITSQNLTGIAYNNYTFVAVGANGTIITLLNQGSWQVVSSGTTSALNGVGASRSLFVAVGAAGTILSSADGVNWIAQSSPTGVTLYGVGFGSTSFVASGAGGTLVTWDGSSPWSAVDPNNIGPAPAGTTSSLYGVSFGNNLFAAVGQTGSILVGPEPAAVWTKKLVGPTPGLKAITSGNGSYLAVGNAGAVIYSPDGSNWSAASPATAQDLNAVVYGNNQFVAVGNAGTILTSFDGHTWSAHFSGTANFNAVVYDNRPGYGRFVAVGDAGTIVSSADGAIWSTVSPAPTAKNLRGIALGDDLLVAVGLGGVILTSPDGATWTSRTGVTKDLNGITVAFKPSGATTYLVAGAAGTLFYSSDAVKWSAAKTLPAAYKTTTFNAIACDFDSTFSTFVAVGNGGAVLASSDGQTWTDRPRVTGQDLAGVSYLDRTYWAVSANGIVLSSNQLDNYIAISAARKDTGAPVATSVIDFGYLETGKTSFAISLKIMNTGQTSNLRVSSLVLTGPNAAEFTVGTPSCGATPTIAPGGSCTVDLWFQPVSAASAAKSATLTINSDDSARPVYPVPLSGNGGLYLQIRPGAHGSILSGSSSGPVVSGPFAVALGATPSFFMSPAAGYYTQEVVLDGDSLGPVSSYSFSPLVASEIPRTLQVFFSNTPHSITASATAGGGLLPGAGIQSVPHGVTQPFAIRASLGHHLESLLVDGAPVALTSLYTFSKVTANHTLEATFTPNSYTVSGSVETNGAADSAGTGGTLTPGSVLPIGACSTAGSSAACDYSSSLTYTITAKPGYRLTNVLVDNASLGPINSYSFASISDNHSIKAVFTNLYDISVSYAGALAVAGTVPNGSLSPAPSPLTGTVSAASGQNKTFTITPAEGYDVLDVKADGASLGSVTSYTFTNVQAAHTLDITFAVRNYPLNVSVGAHGTLQASDGTTLPAQVAVPAHGTKVVNIVPDPDYEVADVLVDGVSVSAVRSYVFMDMTKGHTIEARFAGKVRYLTLSSTGPATPIGGLSFTMTLPATATLPVNPDPGAPLGQVDPAALTVLSGAAGSKFEVSVAPAAGVAAGTARVVLVSGPGFAAGASFLKIAYNSTASPAGTFTPNAPTLVTDTAGNAIAGVSIFASSAAAPSSSANIPGGVYSGALSIALSATPAGAEIHYRTDGGEPTELSPVYKADNSAPIAVTANATLRYFALDRSTGNREAVRTEIYVIDKTVPAAVLSGAPPALTRLTSATLRVGGRDVVSYKYLLDSATKLTSASSAPEIPVATPITVGVPTALSDGAHKLQVIGRDTAGNWQAAATTAQWTVDTALPASTVSPAAGVYNAPISVTLKNAKASAKLYYTLSGNPASFTDGLGNVHPTPEALAYSAPIPVSASTTLRYFALDTAGNAEAEVAAGYTLLTLAVDPPLSPTTLAAARPVFSGSVTPGSLAPSGPATVSVAVARGIALPTVGIATVTGNRWSYDMTTDPGGALVQGLNTITVTATDHAVPPNRFSQTVYVRVAVLPCTTPDGDIDRDGQVTMTDVTLALQMSAGLVPQDVNSCGDVWPVNLVTRVPSKDGSIGVNDALFILQKVMGLASYAP